MKSIFLKLGYSLKCESGELPDFYTDTVTLRRPNGGDYGHFKSLIGFLACCADHDWQAVISRKRDNIILGFPYRATNAIVDQLVDRGFLRLAVKGSKKNEMRSEYAPTELFKDHLVKWRIKWMLDSGHNFTYWKDSKGNKRPDRRKKTPARTHNAYMLEHGFVFGYTDADGNRKIYQNYVSQVFIGSKRNLLGRFYPLGSSLTKEERATLTIDDQQTIELDYKSLHFAMLYHFEGLDAPDDCYQIDDFNRKVSKALALALINSKSERAFLQGAKSSQRARASKYTVGGETFDTWGWNGTESILKGVDVSLWLERFKTKHSVIQGHFHSEDLSLRLQNLDSLLITFIMKELQALDIPYMTVHDSVLVQDQFSMELQFSMERASEFLFNRKFIID